jgi:hypothetical protein
MENGEVNDYDGHKIFFPRSLNNKRLIELEPNAFEKTGVSK